MTMMTATATSIANLFNSSTVYVIPTFQRPYAWEETQWNEMIEDIRTAEGKENPYHYFAPVHLIPMTNPADSLWTSYVDQGIEDIDKLTSSGFQDDGYSSINVFLVIDGQQRLTTFYTFLHQYRRLSIKLANHFEIPKIILNAPDDQIAFRNLLDLHSPAKPVSSISRAQTRFDQLFEKLRDLIASDPAFSVGAPCHKFFMSVNCETLPVTLSGTVRLAAFTTLNDRGKPLTNLEKVKSLFMEIDDNNPTSNPVAINNGFGRLYRSIEAQNSYIDDDEFLRQVAMTLWEGGDLTQINGVDWPRFEPGKTRSNYIHQIGMDTLYEEYFKKIPTGIAASFLHGDIVPAIDKITGDHNALSAITGQSKTGTALNAPSFINSLGCGCAARDAIEDYFSVLISLGLQARQIGFLFEARRLFPSHQWHDVLGSCQFDNQALKNQLRDQLAQIERDPASQDEKVADFINATKEEISAIPDLANRDYTVLQLAEALRLLVGNSKSGGFSGTWFSTFRANTLINVQDFTSRWCRFIASHNSRVNFIMNVSQNATAYNNSLWVKYLLKEYEYCRSGNNAHRNTGFEIEHFFPSAWADSNSSLLPSCGFASPEQYKTNFIERIGNKLLLDSSLNRALKDEDVTIRVGAYQTQAYGNINVKSNNPSQSAIEIGNDLSLMSCAQYRVYVQLRSVRLAIFAAKRF